MNNGRGREEVAELKSTSPLYSNSNSFFYTFSYFEQRLTSISKASIMAPKKTTKAQATREDSQSNLTSQDASQDTGLLAGQMAKTFNEKAKRAASYIFSVREIGLQG